MPNVFFLVLRRMRAPLIALILIYSLSVLGLVLIPGVDAQGRPYRMDFFHAFYFVSYTATTIGFGEVPYPFTYPQRMWVVVCIYLSVIGWAYTIGSTFAILQDKSFQQAVQLARFAGRVRRMSEPFFLVCGYGQTARLLCKVLDMQHIRFVILEVREERVHDVLFADYRVDVPAYAGNAANPQLLTHAGLTHPLCRGVLGITGDEEANLSIAIAAHVLRPQLLSVCRSKTRAVAENMASFGTNRVINMFEAVGAQFRRALHAPHTSRLWDTLSEFPGHPLPPLIEPPRGHWVLVGYGRFGQAVKHALDCERATVTIVDPDPQPELPPAQYVQALGVDAKSLKAAGIEGAVGIVACHDHDANNLSVVATARALNPKLFVVARQNLASNGILFRSFRPDVTVVRSEVMAHECLRTLTTPTLARFLELIHTRSEAWSAALMQELAQLADGKVPDTWVVEMDASHEAVVYALLANPSPPLTLQHLCSHPSARTRRLRCKPLLYLHAGREILLPPLDSPVAFGDRILFAGSPGARSAQRVILTHHPVLDYVRTGQEQPNSWVFRRLAQARRPDLSP
ncbi:NAD-binding protein [Chitiniphilus purpureus]|uniref:NAD-binding protein n=1 Tax=Chitiniphilus purpureus TaxID=2981137 RepID=A0ABY6DI08_9NEIS|nr:NAD-binding protein [Chitiniphilus sp. CD1]UXY13962.1 NAD-binding protein [Chitiniphilus sp. CD1]